MKNSLILNSPPIGIEEGKNMLGLRYCHKMEKRLLNRQMLMFQTRTFLPEGGFLY